VTVTARWREGSSALTRASYDGVVIHGALETSRTIELPRPAEFYTKERVFPFTVATEPCGAEVIVKAADGTKRKVTLSIAPELKSYLDAFGASSITTSLEDATAAAMQFYQGEDSTEWPAERYADKLHMLRYDVGLAFNETSSNSIAHEREILHGEAKKPLVELLGYGLAIVAASKILKIGVDRFAFLLGRESRPDFAATITGAELLSEAATTKIVTSDGLKVGLEAKARSDHMGSFFVTRGENKGKPNDILTSLLQKCSNMNDGDGFLGLVITSEKRHANGTGETRITLADPGTPAKLDHAQETRFLVGALLPKLRRMGVWGTLHSAAAWLRALGETLSPGEDAFLRGVPSKGDAFLPRETFDGTAYRGRIFSDVIRRLGPQGRRQPMISRSEIERRLAFADAGPLWFCGVRLDLVDVIASQDSVALATLGLGDAAEATVRRRIIDPTIADSVLNDLALALPNAK
jgi:hypothetical protein